METKIASLWRRVGGASVDLIIVFLVSGVILFVWGVFIGFNGTEKYLTADESSMLWKGRGMLVGLIADGIFDNSIDGWCKASNIWATSCWYKNH